MSKLTKGILWFVLMLILYFGTAFGAAYLSTTAQPWVTLAVLLPGLFAVCYAGAMVAVNIAFFIEEKHPDLF